MPSFNPFEGLAPLTPEGLRARRYAENAAETKGLDYWVQQSGKRGLEFRETLLEQGRGLTPEDQRAVRSQSILEKAQKSIAEMIKDGSIDPYDAQELAVQQAMNDFMGIGDYQAAQSLIPSLNQIRTYRAELDKLRTESFENLEAGRKARAEATRPPFQNMKDAADAAKAADEAGRVPFQNELDAARADLARRTDPNLRKGDGGGGFDLNKSNKWDVIQQQTGTQNMFDFLDSLSDLYTQAPRAAGVAGQKINTVNQWLAGFQSAIENRGGSIGGYGSLSDDPADSRDGSKSPKEIAAKYLPQIKKNFEKNGGQTTLGMDVTQYQSLVIDTAYAIARTNDPGGRLSDNDFMVAVTTLGAVQDPESAKAQFYSLAKRAHSKYKNLRTSIPSDFFQKEFGTGDRAIEEKWQRFNDLWQPGRTAPVAGTPDKDGWFDVAPGIRIREKK